MRSPDSNIYFALTQEFNVEGRVVVLASGQAVVFYRLAIMSKDGDWVVRETSEACERILDVLTVHGARYRAGAPLDVRWLAGGWSSHFEFLDLKGRRIRCDFFTRPPRLNSEDREQLFHHKKSDETAVVGVEALIRMKQTQRAKDYPVIGELARLLSPERELELTTDPDRVLALAGEYGSSSQRPCVRQALEGRGRLAVVLALAEEIDILQQVDRRRVESFDRAAREMRVHLRRLDRRELELPEGHKRFVELAEKSLPMRVPDWRPL